MSGLAVFAKAHALPLTQALISGVTRIDGYPPSSIIVSDPFAGCRDALGKLGVTPTASNSEVGEQAFSEEGPDGCSLISSSSL